MRKLLALTLAAVAWLGPAASGHGSPQDGSSHDGEAQRLVAALLGDTPLEEDLRSLTDEVGGRPTGSAANRAAVEWAQERFRRAGVAVTREPFEMPELWLETRSAARISTVDAGAPVVFAPRIAAQPFSAGTPAGGIDAPLADGGRGTAEDFARLGDAARGAWLLIETDELADVPGLFAEYQRNPGIEQRALAAGAAGIAYMGSRPRDVLHRHNASLGPDNEQVIVAVERGAAQRALRLLRAGRQLAMTGEVELETGGAFTSENVIGEIRGSELPDEVVVLGAHLDSWALGTGALDNGCNVSMLIDVARQMKRLGLVPRRTLRFALWNGEEQGMIGSWGYTETHAAELDRHVMAASFDIGDGRITGFFLNGRPEMRPVLEAALRPVAGLGPFEHPEAPIVGTDNYDFMVQGVANLVASQESADYGPNYHAGTDTFDKVDLERLRLNAAVTAAVAWGFANADVPWRRQSRAEIERLIETTDLGEQMRSFGTWELWEQGIRGRRP